MTEQKYKNNTKKNQIKEIKKNEYTKKNKKNKFFFKKYLIDFGIK